MAYGKGRDVDRAKKVQFMDLNEEHSHENAAHWNRTTERRNKRRRSVETEERKKEAMYRKRRKLNVQTMREKKSRGRRRDLRID